jgi:hypothetical protein
MKINFASDSGEVFAISPDFNIDEEHIEALYTLACNKWDDIPEADCDSDELTLYVDSEREGGLPTSIEELQPFIDDMNEHLEDRLPALSLWEWAA